MKQELVNSQKERLRRINEKEQIVVGVNEYTETETSPLTSTDGGIETVDPKIELEQVKAVQKWRDSRNQKAVDEALKNLANAAEKNENIMECSIEAAKAGSNDW